MNSEAVSNTENLILLTGVFHWSHCRRQFYTLFFGR